MRKRRIVPLAAVLAMGATSPKSRPVRAGIQPVFEDAHAVPDCVIEDGRRPKIEPIGVFDPRGQMLYRIEVPIRQKMGFFTGGNRWTEDAEEALVTILPEDMIDVSTDGSGLAHIDAAELEDDEEEEG